MITRSVLLIGVDFQVLTCPGPGMKLQVFLYQCLLPFTTVVQGGHWLKVAINN